MDRLKVAIESLHETIACSVGTRSHHSGEMLGEYGSSNSQSAPVDVTTYAGALSCEPNFDVTTRLDTNRDGQTFSRDFIHTVDCHN